MKSFFARRAISPMLTSTTITAFATRNGLIVNDHGRVNSPETRLIKIAKLLFGIPKFCTLILVTIFLPYPHEFVVKFLKLPFRCGELWMFRGMGMTFLGWS